MATASFSYPIPSQWSTGTNLRQTFVSIFDAIDAVGLVQTADTGQLDPATVTSGPTELGYGIWRFDDDLQAVAPLFMKIEFSMMSTSSLRPRITVGRGSDGAGNITSPFFTQQYVGFNSGPMASNSAVVSSGDGSMFAFILPAVSTLSGSGNISGPQFILDRSRDHNGDPTADGIMFAARQGTVSGNAQDHTSNTNGVSNAPYMDVYSYSTGLASSGIPPVAVPYQIGGSTLAAGTGVGGGMISPVFPWLCFAPGEAPWQAIAVLSYAGADVPAGTRTVRVLGKDRTYMFIAIPNSHTWGIAPNPAGGIYRSIGIGILWE